MTETAPTPRLDRFLRIFADVRTGEGATALLLALNVFLILMAYYVLKPVREALILGGGSAELKSYMSAAQVVALAIIVPYYGRLVARFARMRLINMVTAFFIGCLVVFYALSRFGVPLGVVFFLWIGIFNLMIVAQFWSFANDIYSKEEGERLFPIVGFGASLGAVAGAGFAGRLIGPVGVYELMLLGAVVLAAQLFITNRVDARAPKRASAAPPKKATGGSQAFAMVFRSRYLLLMAVMLMLLNLVNTTGEYILGSVVKHTAEEMIADGRAGGLTQEALIGGFYSKYFALVNVLGLVLQLFVVSRVVKYLGVGWSVMILPFLSFTAYGVIVAIPLLYAVLAAKVAENATDYSLNNTVKNMLFLPCTREEKYTAKQAIDSFFVRIGDVLSAVLVFVGSQTGLHPRGFAAVAALLVLAWLVLAWRVGRTYDNLTEAKHTADAADAAPAPA